MPLSCVLISDITGSTQLYENETNHVALEQVDLVLNRMRAIVEDAKGHCVKSQGDDTLSFFDHPEPAFQVARQMIQENWPAKLSVHVGMYFGEILNHEDDIYGRAVNTAARLASLAKPGEILLGDKCFDELAQASKDKFLMIGELQLRGKKTPTRVYSCSIAEMSEQTVIFSKPDTVRTDRTEFAEIGFQGKTWQISEGETLSIGRSNDCDIVLNQPRVSRKHAVLTLRRWQLEFTDHSSTGSTLTTIGGTDINVHRGATLLSGDGAIRIGSGADNDPSTTVFFTTHGFNIRAAPE